MQSCIRFLAAAAVGGLCAHAAHANCDRLVDALDKADKQERVAQYDVESRDQPLTGKPMIVRIGKVMYDGSLAGNVFEAHPFNGSNPILAALRKSQQSGKLKCESLGSDSFRGAPAEKFRFDNPAAPAKFNPTTMWIAKSTGLPVYHEMNGLGPGGFAWTYGAAVKDPVVKK
jgi:hypothetical protein